MPANRPRACAAALAYASIALTTLAGAETLYGYTASGQSLVSFDSANPGLILSTRAITGLAPGDSIRGIDFRESDARLYALGAQGRLYTINTATGASTQVGGGPFAVALSGASFGFDIGRVFVSPGVFHDQAHIVSDTGQHLRIDPDTGAVIDLDSTTPGLQIDAPLAYVASDPNSGTTPQITGFAFGPLPAGGGVALGYLAIDSNLNTLATFVQTVQGDFLLTQGPIGLDAQSRIGLDFSFASYTLYASMIVQGATGGASLFSIDRLFAAPTDLGAIGPGGGLQIDGIAVAPVPEPGAAALVALAGAGAFARRRHR